MHTPKLSAIVHIRQITATLCHKWSGLSVTAVLLQAFVVVCPAQ